MRNILSPAKVMLETLTEVRDKEVKSMANSSRLALRQNLSWVLVGNGIYAATQWATLSVLAKLGTPEMVGQFTLGLAVVAPISVFVGLQLRGVLATDAREEYVFDHYLGLRLLTMVFSFIVTLGIIAVSGYGTVTGAVVLLVALAKAVESVSDIFYGLFQNLERMDCIAKSMIARGVLSVTAFSVALYLGGGVIGGIVAIIVSSSLVLLVYDIPSGGRVLWTSKILGSFDNDACHPRQSLRPSWDFRKLAQLAWLSLPLGLVMLLGSLVINVPRYFVERSLGASELGFFASMAYLQLVGSMVLLALGNAASPKLAQYFASGNHAAFTSLMKKMLGVAGLLGVSGLLIAILAGNRILEFLYTPEYAGHQSVLRLIMISAALSYVAIVLGRGMTAARYFRSQVPIYVTSLGASIFACIWLIPVFGMAGAALAMIAASLVQVVGSVLVLIFGLRGYSTVRLCETSF